MYNDDIVALFIYRYIVENKSIAKVAESIGLPVEDVSVALTHCGIAGKNNVTGESNFKGGSYKGKYPEARYKLKNPKEEGPDFVPLGVDVLCDYVRMRFDDDTLEDYLERTYGKVEEPPKFSLLAALFGALNVFFGKRLEGDSASVYSGINIKKVIRLILFLGIFSCIFNLLTLFKWGYERRIGENVGFFAEIKGNFGDAYHDGLVNKTIMSVQRCLAIKQNKQFEKDVEELRAYRSREATEELVSVYALGDYKYIGKRLDNKPYMDCFRVSLDGSECMIGNYDENGALFGMAIKYEYHDGRDSSLVYSIGEIGIYHNGEMVSGIRARADLIDGIKAAKYSSGQLEGFILHQTPDGELYLEKENGVQVGKCVNKEWVDMEGNPISNGDIIDGYTFNSFNSLKIENNKVYVFDNLVYLSGDTLGCWQNGEMDRNIHSIDLMNGDLSYDTKIDDLWKGAKMESRRSNVTCEFLDNEKRSNTTRTMTELIGDGIKCLSDLK